MKQFPAFFFVCITMFFVLSCAGVDPSKKYPYMVANADPVSAGMIEVGFDRMGLSRSGKLNKVEVEVIFYPRLNSAALEFRYETVKYRQFWDATGRVQFANALERYKQDRAARVLIQKYNKTRAVYGKVKGRAEWETFRFSKVRISHPVIELGYRFRGETPLFTTLMRSAKEEDTGSSENMESRQITMYFTRAQADELVKLFNQEYLMGLLPVNNKEPVPAIPADDGYYDD